MFKSKQNNGISKVRPNGDTPLSITPTPKSDLEIANEAANKAVQDAKDKLKSQQRAEMEDKRKRMNKNKSQELESYLMQQAESKKKNN